MSKFVECWDSALDFRAGRCTWVCCIMLHRLRRLQSTTGVTAGSSKRTVGEHTYTNKQVKRELCNSCMLRVRWTPHPVIVTMRDNGDYIKALSYSDYAAITGWGVILS